MKRTLCWAIWLPLAVALLLFFGPAAAQAAPPMYGPVVHVVQWGENLTVIAGRYGVGVQELAAANRLSNPNRIYVGQRLVVPLPPGPTTFPTENVVRHVVQSGDTLSSLAVRYRSTVDAIVQVNRLVNPSYIYVGQVLFVPSALPSEPGSGFYYAVRAGDTLARIACRYGVSSWAIAQVNNLANPSLIYVGQTLFVPGAVEPPAPTPTPTGGAGTPLPTATPVPTTCCPATTPQPTSKPKPPLPTATPSWLQCTPPPLGATPPLPTCAVPTTTPVPLGPVPLPSPGPVKSMRMASPEYGIEIDVWGMGNCVTDRDLILVRQAGFTWVRQVFPWRGIEVQKDRFEWAEADRIVAMVAKYDLDLAVAVAYQPEWAGGGYPLNGPPRNMADIADFMAALARRYKGLVRAYEIWPGPNVSQNWGGQSPDPQRYAEMLRNAYWYAKKEDPFAMIISGGLVQTARHDGSSMPPETFFRALFYETDARSVCDVFGAQAFGFKAAPENTPDEAANPDLNNNYPATRELNRIWCFRSVELLRAVQESTPGHWPKDTRQWAIAHLGWTTDTRERSLYHWAAVSPQVQADYLRRAYRWAKDNWSGWVGVMFVPLTNARWTMNDDGYWWGIINPDGCPRPAYHTLKAIAK